MGDGKKKESIPWAVLLDDNEIATDHEIVLNKWADDYENLYNNILGDFDEVFLREKR